MRKGSKFAGAAAFMMLLVLRAGAQQPERQQPSPAPSEAPGQNAGSTAKDTSSKPAAAKSGAKGADQKAISDLLENRIGAAWKAFKDKDKKAYAEFLTDDFMAVEEDGDGERTKMKVLREIDASVVHDFKLQLFRVDPIAAGAQLVTYENVIQFPPGARVRFEKIFISEIWVKRGGEWKSWRYQATKVK